MIIKSIDLLMPPRSQYEVMHHFTRSLAEALTRQGIRARVLEAVRDNPGPFLDKILSQPPDCTLCFNGLLPDEQGHFFSDLIRIPHVACLIDSPHYFLSLIHSPYTIITCVDRYACQFFNELQFKNTLFFPHGVDRKLITPTPLQTPRPYDVVMLGSFSEYRTISLNWAVKYGRDLAKTFEEAAEITMSDSITSYPHALAKALDSYSRRMGGFNPNSIDFISVITELERYIKSKDRIALVQAIKDAEIHIFGADSQGWLHHLADRSNIVIHDPVNYDEAIEIMKKSKIVLNSSPFFKDGSHERIFTGLACGAAVLTNENIYLREFFKHEENILFYQYPHSEQINECINTYLKDPEKRYELVAKGQEVVSKHHTWDNRAATLIQSLPPLLERVRKQTRSA